MASLKTNTEKAPASGRGAATMVGAGILSSRILGLIRDRVFAHYFGNSDAADAFRAAFRIPNFLQNLFGEGVLSASFIPAYARLNAEGRREEAAHLAEAIFGILFLTTSVLVVVGILTTPWLIAAIAPGFKDEKRLLTIELVRILFPGAGLLVFAAWCLGILNSHRKFFLSYAAPVVWNLAIIAALLWRGAHEEQSKLSIIVAFASVAGSALQLGVQLPSVIGFLRPLRMQMHFASEHVRSVIRNFFPVFVSRGVVQISAYIDSLLASYLPTGAVAALSYAQTLYTLPVSLFGMSVSAAELPAMSSALGTDEEIAATLRQRLSRGLEQISLLVVPSAVAFLALGDVVVATIYRSGRFGPEDVTYVWAVMAGSAVGLLASTYGRLYSSAFFALRNTRTPLNFSIVRVALTLGLGFLFALRVPKWIGMDPRWGVAGLTLSAGLAGWVEFVLLRYGLHKRIGVVPHATTRLLKLWMAALIAAAFGYGVKLILPFSNSPRARDAILVGVCVLGAYGVLYFLLMHWMGIASLRDLTSVLRGRRR